ncbi:class I SAM-dependent methyltransferase [Rapidithrix thailandica]|uniref:Class I SAM-dependent methyltransferase n=1 Tax=Rapidithrix thailandica TaxID=413964 RepID=A0AAW9SJ05_9BACT
MDYLQINKQLWNDKTDFHFQSEFYAVDAFLKGQDALNSIELDLLGDIKDKKILHLQCHFGMDTISLSRHGAEATGVDFSEKAIEKARHLQSTLGTNTRFIQSDIYSLHELLDEQFDIVYTSYGVIGWLPDMDLWANTIRHFLKPGGSFIMVEFHPVVWMFSNDFQKIEYHYSDSQPIIEETQGTYANPQAEIQGKSVSWNHGLAKVLNALIQTGLSIRHFQEWDYSPYDCFDNTIEIEKGKFQIKGLEQKIPMLYSVVAQKSHH